MAEKKKLTDSKTEKKTTSTKTKKRTPRASRKKEDSPEEYLKTHFDPSKSPLQYKNMKIPPDKVVKGIDITRALFDLPDLDLCSEDTTPEMIQQRVDEFFDIYRRFATKPTVSGLALALGIPNRQLLYAIVGKNPQQFKTKWTELPSTKCDTVKKAYSMMEVMWEEYMQDSQVNPASGIFLGKNHYGYQDQVEHKIVAETQKEPIDAEAIKQRYIESDNN